MSLEAVVKSLIGALRQGVPMLVRAAPDSGDALEGVLARQDLATCQTLLQDAFGQAVKGFNQPAKVDRKFQPLVDALGGIRADQCLYLHAGEAEEVAFATLWPWASDAARITLKVGIRTIRL